jgi:glycosyltransferase involved in cell wall biosynthesis
MRIRKPLKIKNERELPSELRKEAQPGNYSPSNTKPKLAIIQTYIPQYKESFFNKLQQRGGLEVCLIHGENQTESREVVTNQNLLFDTRSIKRTYRVSFLGFEIVFQRGVIKALRAVNPEVVVADGTIGILSNFLVGLFCKITRRPFVVWACGWEKQKSGLKIIVKRFFYHLQAVLADVFIVYGSKARDYLESLGVDLEKVVLAQNTVDTDEIFDRYDYFVQESRKLRMQMGLTNKRIILFVGRVNRYKRLDILLGAYRVVKSRLRDVALLIVGDGPELDNIKREVARDCVPDIYFRNMTFSEVNPYFAMCNLFVIPGLGGLAINQAMCFSKPIVCSEADGTEIDLVIDGLNGYRVEPGNEEKMAEAILKIMSSSATQKAMGEYSLKILKERATIADMVENFQKAVRLSLDRKTTKARR